MTRITIASPVWKRPEMTLAFLEHIEHHQEHTLSHGIKLNMVVVGSEGFHSRPPARKCGHTYIEFPNDPLGAKFNAGIKRALDDGCDYVMILGSDTFFLPAIWQKYAEFIATGAKFVGVTDCYMMNWDRTSAVYWRGYKGTRKGRPVGPGRLIHKSLIPDNGELYKPELNRNLDSSLVHRMEERCKVFESKPYLLTSCKETQKELREDGGSITNINDFKGQTVPVETDMLEVLFKI